MPINHLLNILKHGYSYTHVVSEQPVQELVAPNKYMRAAAQLIEKLARDNQTLQQQNLQLQAILSSTLDDLNNAKTQIQPSVGVPESSPTNGPGTSTS